MDQNQIDQSIRLKKLIKALNLNQSSFAKSLGMTQPNISRMVNGEGKVSVEVINGITKNYTEVNLHWLLTGDGEMFLDSKGLQANEDAVVYGKGWLEGLEERVTRLEREMEQLRKG
jgi:transcriptional regulator with XRE-family HTH domain